MRRYPEYKNSQLGWVGKIPEHWDVIKFHYLSQESRKKNDDDVDREMLSLSSYTGIQVKQYEYENTKRSKEESLTYLVVEPNQLVVNPMWQIQRGIGVSYLHGIVSPGYRVYYIDLERLIPQYLHYLMRSDGYVDEYNKHIRGLTTYDRSVRKEDFEEIGVLLPSKQEQIQIANFLDRKTGQIDELIRIKERKIELLYEQRTVLINQAVTKGLDPNVEMKPSGVEWIGEIPAHWEVVRNKFIFQQIRDVCYPNLLLLSIGIKGIVPKSQTGQKDVSSADKSLYKRVKIGDIAFNVMTAWKGGIGMSDYEGIVSPAYQVCRPTTKLVSKYFHYLFRTDLYKTTFDRASYQVVDQRHNLYYDNFKNISVIFPSFSEQTQIADFLDRKTGQIDELRSNEQQSIELLKEYRQTLISEVVTGKIDVRSEV